MDIAKDFLEKSRAYLSSDFLPKIESCLQQISDEDIWWRDRESANSIGNLLLHLEGSTRAWIVGVAGGAQISRNRQQEFDERQQISRAELNARLKRVVAEADQTLSEMDPQTLSELRQSPMGEVTALEAIYHAVEHFSMHTGQIILIAKMRVGADFEPMK